MEKSEKRCMIYYTLFSVLHFSLKIITYRFNKQSCKERLLKPKTEVWTLKQNEKQ